VITQETGFSVGPYWSGLLAHHGGSAGCTGSGLILTMLATAKLLARSSKSIILTLIKVLAKKMLQDRDLVSDKARFKAPLSLVVIMNISDGTWNYTALPGKRSYWGGCYWERKELLRVFAARVSLTDAREGQRCIAGRRSMSSLKVWW